MSGEKNKDYIDSVAKAREEVEVKNIKSIAEYSQATRAIAREAQDETKGLKSLVAQQNMKIQELEAKINTLLIEKYSGGVTTGS